MKIRNTTNIADERLREIIDFVKPNHLPTSTFTVKLTNSSSDIGSGGKCYGSGTGYTNRPTIIVNLSPNEKGYPYWRTYKYRIKKTSWQQPNKKTGELEEWYGREYIHDPTKKSPYIDHLVMSREESLVNTLAHEFRHFWQCNHKGKRGKVWGARGRISEKDASAYGIRKAREWRRLNAPRQVFPDDAILFNPINHL